MYRKVFILLLSSLLFIFAGCEKEKNQQPSTNSQAAASPAGATENAPTASTDSDKAKFDICGLLKKEEIQSVQGSAIKDTKSSGRSDGAFRISQCFYTAEDFSKSVSLAITQSDPDYPSKRSPKEFWTQTFHRDEGEENEREREKGKEREKERDKDKDRDKDKERGKEAEREKGRGKGEEEEEEATPPKKIAGIGDEAYWTGSRVGGALYVLKKDAFIRISIGGPDNEETKINKSKTLAQKALQRL